VMMSERASRSHDPGDEHVPAKVIELFRNNVDGTPAFLSNGFLEQVSTCLGVRW
jgi:hypothetical protein